MELTNSRLSSLYHWFLVLVLSAGFCLGFTFNADAQLLPEDTLVNTTFNIDRWSKRVPQNIIVYYGADPLLYAVFTYKGTEYFVHSISSSHNRVKVGITPSFPPEGSPRSYFNLYVGSVGNDLRKFNFGDTNNNEWPGQAGFLQGYIANDDRTRNGILRITAIDESVADNLRFAKFRPKPDETSGRLEFVRKLENGEEKLFRVCDNGDNEFGKEEARVACRQLGIEETSNAEPIDLSATDWLTSSTPGLLQFWISFAEVLSIYGSPALLDNIQCEGDEKRLIDCNHLGFGVVSGGNCPVNNTVAVDCDATSSTDNSNSGSDNNDCICGQAPNGQCWSSQHCGQGGGFGE